MTATHIESYLSADIKRRQILFALPEVQAALKAWLGDAAFAELARLPPARAHLGIGPRLLFVPGIMGSTLQSQLGGTWWLDVPRARDKLNGLALAPDGKGDADVGARLSATGIDLTYEAFGRAILADHAFQYETFPFDWRRLVTDQTSLLKDRILGLHKDSGNPVHLVGHSLGGLMSRATLMHHGPELWPAVGKIVFLGTPHYGSPSIAGYLKNHLWGWNEMAVLGMYLSRETFRSLWGALSLLPAPAGIYPGTQAGADHPCANFDLYSVQAWGLDLNPLEAQRLELILKAVAEFHGSLHAWHGTLTRDQRARMLVIAGVGYPTLFRLECKKRFLWGDTKLFTERDPDVPNYEGDGRVSVAAATLEDVMNRYVKGRHGSLQNLPAVSSDVLAWLKGKALQLPTSVKGALTSHLAGPNQSPTPLLEGFGPTDDGYDRYRDLTDAELAVLKEKFERGDLPGVQWARLL
jgi:pimeloyl-ACP methyl ester carboxylesterase